MRNQEQSKSSFSFLPLIIGIVSAFSMIVGMRLQDSLVADGILEPSPKRYTKAIREASDHIRTKYYGPVNDTSFTDAVIHTMVEQLDPYSYYFEKSNDEKYNRYMQGLFTGLGIEFYQDGDTTYIFDVLKESMAYSFGIRPGQIVESLDSMNLTDDHDLQKILGGIDRTIGSILRISTYDLHNDTSVDTTLIVSSIDVPIVQGSLLYRDNEKDSIPYVRIKRFHKEVFADFMKVLEGFNASTDAIDRIIIDLRDNPGGVVEETVKLLNQMIAEEGKTLLLTKTNAEIAKSYASNGRSFLQLDRIVLLLNEYSASASEILAGVLQDYDQAILVGESSYGKGFIQQNYDLSNEGSLNLSIGEYVLPGGRIIRRDTASFKDTVYYSLENNRPFVPGRGIPVDVSLSKCEASIKLKNTARAFILKHGLRRDLIQYDELRNLAEKEQLDSSALCKEAIVDQLIWVIEDMLIENESWTTTDVRKKDRWIQESYDIIRTDRYDRLIQLVN